MVANKKTLAALDAYAVDQTQPESTVYVQQRFITWLQTRPQPMCHYEGWSIRFKGCDHVVNLVNQPSVGIHPEGSYVWGRNLNGYPNFRTLRRVDQREGESGFVKQDEVVEWMREPLMGSDLANHWEIIHWITNPQRVPEIDIYSLTFESVAFLIKNPALVVEFKLTFHGRS